MARSPNDDRSGPGEGLDPRAEAARLDRPTIFAGEVGSGAVHTQRPDAPRAEALAIRGDRVVAVGRLDEVEDALGADARRAERIELGEGALLPGFHDAHVHLTQHGQELEQLRLDEAATLDDALAVVGAAAARTPPGSWLLGTGFALQRWGVDTLRAAWLDRVAPDHPVLIRSQDHHSAWANRRALAETGVDADTPDPPHGEIVRDAEGRPDGLLLERAFDLLRDRMPAPSPVSLRAALDAAGRDFARRGVTTVHHMAYEPAAYWRELALAASDPTYPLRVWACLPHEDLEHAAALGIATGQGGADFTVGGAKFFADGALGSRTAWMLEPYPGGGTGVTVDGPEVLAERIPAAIAAGLTPVVHAIGDAATRAVLDAFEANADALRAAGLRPRLEHAQHLHDDDVARVAAVGAVASVQPLHLTFDAPSIRSLLASRAHHAYRFRGLHESGALLAFGSDTPVAPVDVGATLRAATERIGVDGAVLGPDERIGLDLALAAMTRNAAAAIQRERRSGALAPGYDADLVWLATDPHVLDDLRELEVRGTLKGGRWTYRA